MVKIVRKCFERTVDGPEQRTWRHPHAQWPRPSRPLLADFEVVRPRPLPLATWAQHGAARAVRVGTAGRGFGGGARSISPDPSWWGREDTDPLPGAIAVWSILSESRAISWPRPPSRDESPRRCSVPRRSASRSKPGSGG
jgi:hypothetical protein